ncbi:MAG: ABC transporter permease subunit [Devosia sp.]|jgi:putrescine transport system permease protein|nr:ABC transporter permease subunit [Devosiaceae bacterium]
MSTAEIVGAEAPRGTWRPWGFFRTRLEMLGIGGRWVVILPPLLWLIVFFLVPLAVVIGIAFSESIVGQPPYLPLLTISGEGDVQLTLHLSNFIFLTQDHLYLDAWLSSLKIAFISTVLALLVGYPMAYFIARSSDRARNILLMLVILPFWSSFLLRVYAWIGFLKNNGVINNFLGLLHLPQVTMLYTDFAVYVGIVYTYLPFMILPLYTNLVKLDQSLLEASADLGARPIRTFLSVTLPLSLPGIIAGSMLVFIPAIGEYVIPQLLGGPSTLMIGRVLWDEFFSNRDWPLASAVAIAMLVVVVVPLMLLQRAQSEVVERQ